MAELDGVSQYVVNGYVFGNRTDYEAALQEKKGILYLNEQTDLNDTAKVMKLYHELIEKRVFSTPVGMDYLKQLRRALLKAPGVNAADVPYVYVLSANAITNDKAEKYVATKYDKAVRELKKGLDKQKYRRRVSFILNIILAIVVIAMFIILSTSSTPTVLDYERKIQDKYSQWESELKSKEDELRQWEKELVKREHGLEDSGENNNSSEE